MRATPAPTDIHADDLSPAVRPDAAAYEAIVPDAEAGVLLSHGFTGSPKGMRPWAAHLESAGYSVSVPLLPGHGTSWQDMNTTTWKDWLGALEDAYGRLRAAHERVFVAGLSMGGALALRMAQVHPEIAGVMLVNPAIASRDPRMKALPVLKHLLGSTNGVSGDIAKKAEDPSIDEGAYDRSPLKAASSMANGLWPLVRAELGRVNQPVLYFHSRTDHVVDEASTGLIVNGVGSRDVTLRMLARSWHVATLDYEADDIFRESVEWMRAR